MIDILKATLVIALVAVITVAVAWGVSGCVTEECHMSYGDYDNPEDAGIMVRQPGRKPPRTAWSASGTLISGSDQEEVSLQAQFEVPGYYTIYFGLEQENVFANVIDCTAEIAFSLEGTTIRRQVSVGSGTAISGVGEAVDISVRDTTDPNIATGQPYEVTVQVGRGVRPATTRPPTLRVDLNNIGTPGNGLFYTLLPGPSTAVYNVPQNVGAISVEVSLVPVGGSDYPIENVAVYQASLPVGTQKGYDPLIQTGFVDLIPGTQSINISNRSTKDYYVQVTFGIDG